MGDVYDGSLEMWWYRYPYGDEVDRRRRAVAADAMERREYGDTTEMRLLIGDVVAQER